MGSHQQSTTPRDDEKNLEQFLPYEQLAKDTGISEATLRKETSPEYWSDRIDMSKAPTILQLQSYAGCAIADLRTTTQKGATLLSSYIEDFEGWTLKDFSALGRAFKRELVQVLEDKGITPQSDGKVTQAQKLYDMAQGKADAVARTQPLSLYGVPHERINNTPPPEQPPQPPQQRPPIIAPQPELRYPSYEQ